MGLLRLDESLNGVLDTVVGDREGVNDPDQVESMFRLPLGQPFSQSSLINLNHVDPSLLKILNFILDDQGNLVVSPSNL